MKTFTTDNQKLGLYAEKIAADYVSVKLRETIIERNFTCKVGELDIVSRKGSNTFCFYEVKSVSQYGKEDLNNDIYRPEYNLGKRKIEKMIRASLYYLKTLGIQNLSDISLSYHLITVTFKYNGSSRIAKLGIIRNINL